MSRSDYTNEGGTLFTKEEKESLLRAEALDGDSKKVQNLLEQGVDATIPSPKHGWNAIELAATKGHIDVLTKFQLKISPEETGRKEFGNGTNVLHNISSSNELTGDSLVELVGILAKMGYDVNKAERNGITPLHVAANAGNFSMVEALINNGADLNAKAGDKTALNLAKDGFESDQGQSYEAIAKLIEQSESWQARGENIALLEKGARNNDLEAVKSLIAKGTFVNQADSEGETPLLLACKNGNVKMVHALLDASADFKQGDRDGEPPLFAAVRKGNSEIVQLLLDKGANINQANNDGNTILHLAASKGAKRTVSLLLKSGADANIGRIKPDGKFSSITPLHEAAASGNTGIVEALLAGGAKIDQPRKDGATPLHIAAINGSTKVIELLVEWGANINAQITESGLTAMHIAAIKSEGKIGVVEALANSPKIDFTIKDEEGVTARDLAKTKGFDNIVSFMDQIMARKVVEGEKRGPLKTTELMKAALNGDTNRVQMLLNAGSDINKENGIGLTALHAAAQGGHKEIAQLLIENGAEINHAKNDGNTALHSAAKRGRAGVVNLLLNNGADTTLTNKQEQDACGLATKNDHKTIAESITLKRPVPVNVSGAKRDGDLKGILSGSDGPLEKQDQKQPIAKQVISQREGSENSGPAHEKILEERSRQKSRSHQDRVTLQDTKNTPDQGR